MKRFKNILYVYEQSVAQEATMARAVSLAQNNQASLNVIDVIPEVGGGIGMPPGGPVSTDLKKFRIEERLRVLEALTVPYRDRLPVNLDVIVGKTFIEVIRAVLRNDHDLVIKPAENPEWLDRLFGSDDMHLLRKCPCPLWLTRPAEKPNYERILAAIDFDPNDPAQEEQALNDEILQLASSLAVSDFADLHLVHVWDAPEADFVRLWANDPEEAGKAIIEGERSRHEKGMQHYASKLYRAIGAEAYDYLSPRIHLPRGSASTTIPVLVGDLKADLLVMGTVARTGIPGLFIGNTAEAILEQLQCSVLAIKPPGFVSPVKLE